MWDKACERVRSVPRLLITGASATNALSTERLDLSSSCTHCGQTYHCDAAVIVMLILHSYWRLPDTSASRHYGTLRHRSQDTTIPKTWYETLRLQCRDRGKAGTLQPRTIPIETQLHRWFDLNFGTNFVVPKCLVAEVSGSLTDRLWHRNMLNSWARARGVTQAVDITAVTSPVTLSFISAGPLS